MLVQETATLTREQRAQVDAELGPRPQGWSEAEVGQRARAVAYRLDPAGLVQRVARAERDRRVSCRPAPEGMTWLSALLPMAQGIACQVALGRAADTARTRGDGRGRGQLMADLLVERVTGLPPGRRVNPDGRGATGPPAVPVEVQLVVSAAALWGEPGAPSYAAPGQVPGYGPVPAWLARRLLRDAPDDGPVGRDGPGRLEDGQTAPEHGPPEWPAGTDLDPDHDHDADPGDEFDGGSGADPGGECPGDAFGESRRAGAWLRRLWVSPETGALVALESRRRVFTGSLRRFLVARDGVCRTPWCDAPVRHVDHVVPHAAGGPTSAANGPGLCARCNQAKEMPGWSARPATTTPEGPARRERAAPDSAHHVVLVTPTGHRHGSTAPPVLPALPEVVPC